MKFLWTKKVLPIDQTNRLLESAQADPGVYLTTSRAVLTDKNKLGQLKAYVDKYLSIFHPPIILDGSMISQIHEKIEV